VTAELLVDCRLRLSFVGDVGWRNSKHKKEKDRAVDNQIRAKVGYKTPTGGSNHPSLAPLILIMPTLNLETNVKVGKGPLAPCSIRSTY